MVHERERQQNMETVNVESPLDNQKWRETVNVKNQQDSERQQNIQTELV